MRNVCLVAVVVTPLVGAAKETLLSIKYQFEPGSSRRTAQVASQAQLDIAATYSSTSTSMTDASSGLGCSCASRRS